MCYVVKILPASGYADLDWGYYGELMLLYGVSDVAFVGGSLVKHGGHNPLEPGII